jgi:biotin operon repressor
MLGETHIGEIAVILGRSRSRIKDAVDGLEREGVIVGALEGTARRLRLNPRYVAAQELARLLNKLAINDVDLQKHLASVRRRPRRAGKTI